MLKRLKNIIDQKKDFRKLRNAGFRIILQLEQQ